MVHDAVTGLEVLAAVVALCALIVVVITLGRYRAIAHHRLTAVCAVRQEGRGWVHGVLRYGGDNVHFFRLGGMSRRATLRWSRAELELGAHLDVPPPGGIGGDVWVVEIRAHEQPLQLAIRSQDYLAFRAWLESAPPGWQFTES